MYVRNFVGTGFFLHTLVTFEAIRKSKILVTCEGDDLVWPPHKLSQRYTRTSTGSKGIS